MFEPLLSAVLPEVGLGLPRDVAVGGARIDALLTQTAVASGAVALLLTGVLLLGALRRARQAAPARPRSTLIAALAIFAAIDGNLLVRGDVGQSRAEASAPVIQFEVNAHQWAWDVRAPGADGRFGTPDDVVVLNEMVVPVGQPVDVELASVDVVHGFSVPNLRIKADAVPGQITHLTFAVAEEGDYEIACAQHCGLNHYKMRGVLHAVSTTAYREWRDRESRQALAADDPADVRAHWAWPWGVP